MGRERERWGEREKEREREQLEVTLPEAGHWGRRVVVGDPLDGWEGAGEEGRRGLKGEGDRHQVEEDQTINEEVGTLEEPGIDIKNLNSIFVLHPMYQYIIFWQKELGRTK